MVTLWQQAVGVWQIGAGFVPIPYQAWGWNSAHIFCPSEKIEIEHKNNSNLTQT